MTVITEALAEEFLAQAREIHPDFRLTEWGPDSDKVQVLENGLERVTVVLHLYASIVLDPKSVEASKAPVDEMFRAEMRHTLPELADTYRRGVDEPAGLLATEWRLRSGSEWWTVMEVDHLNDVVRLQNSSVGGRVAYVGTERFHRDWTRQP